ncbi:MAG: histidinol-phosphate transaminase [Cyanobacteria bacterium J083]|nr:MAG: histidinol-phosphate transaminase [Cyanobacteria bacterium J083]
MFDFIRSDLDKLTAYTPHPGGNSQGVIDRLDTNESPYDLPGDLKDKLAWTYLNQIENNRYPDGSHQQLKEAIAEYVNESANLEGTFVTNNISIGNGSDELIRSILIATCLGGEGSILVAHPTFSMYSILAKTLGIEVITIPRKESDFSIDLDAAKQAVTQTNQPSVRVVFVVHPNSPTANNLTEAEISWLKSLPANILVVIDEAYFEFSGNSLVNELPQNPNWLILRTFSKAFRLATHRLGYAIAHPELIALLEKVRLPYNLPSFSQSAALIALQNRQEILPTVKEILAERDKLFAKLAAHPQIKVWRSDANFIYLRLQASLDLAELVEKLKTQGTLLRYTGDGLRITVGTAAENKRTYQRLTTLLELHK